MGFETNVLSRVSEVLGTDHRATFEYGTLFLSAVTEEQAKSVFQTLSAAYRCPVELNKVGDEYAYDFI